MIHSWKKIGPQIIGQQIYGPMCYIIHDIQIGGWSVSKSHILFTFQSFPVDYEFSFEIKFFKYDRGPLKVL